MNFDAVFSIFLLYCSDFRKFARSTLAQYLILKFVILSSILKLYRSKF